MNVTKRSQPVKKSMIKRVVGAVAVALIVMFTILFMLDTIFFAEWIVAEVIVALIANIIFRIVNKRSNK